MLAEKRQTMNHIDTMRNQRVLIVGLGQTGLSCARYLAEHGVEVEITDSRQHPPALEELQQVLPNVAVFVGGFNVDAFSHSSCLIVSPGISLKEPLIAEARARGVEVIGYIELFARNVNASVIAITGSNGKSTVTTLVAEMAKKAGLDVRMGGNIGIPALDLLHQPQPNLYVLELSSFQLETTNSLNAHTAVLLNISEDHMDRYHDLTDYTTAKAKVYHGSGTLIVNLDDERVVATVNLIRHGRKMIGFTKHKPDHASYGICHKNGEDWLCFADTLLMPVSALAIKGLHNITNALAALALGRDANIPLPFMLDTLKTFQGLAHRSQWVCEKKGVSWFNDSKATNVAATIAAIEGLAANKIILIAGGQAKGQDFIPLQNVVNKKVRHIFLMGQDANMINDVLNDYVEISYVKNLRQAVVQAQLLAERGDVVLFSPACASFDMFTNFEQRGNMFIACVKEIVQ